MYWINSLAKATGLKTEETSVETESKSADINEEPDVTDSNKSLDRVQSEDVLDSGNKETVKIEKDKVSEGSQQLVGETDSRIGEIQSLDKLDNLSAEKELGSLDNVLAEKDLESLDSVSAEKELGLQSDRSKASISMKKSSLKFEEQGAESKDGDPENKGLAGEEESVNLRRDESSMSLSTSSKDKDRSMTAEKRQESLISTSIQSCKLGLAESLTGSVMKDQSCQASCSLDDANVDELRMLKEKLAISKKDTETMQNLLEDVRNDYEDLQKSFEKRDREIKKKEKDELNLKLSKTDGSISSVCNDTPQPKSSELRPKSSQLRSKSSELRPKSFEIRPKSSEKRRRGPEKSSVTSREKLVESSDLTCPCLTQNVRQIITDVTEDFKEVISAIKKSSAEERETIGSEFARFKDEYKCALEKKEFEIRAMEETIKGLQARIREAEREGDKCRKTISLAFAEKEKLHLGIHGLNEELIKAQHEREISQANLETIKDCLKRYCTAEEYEELQRMDFKFSEDRKVDETSGSQMKTDSADYKRRKDNYYPVLRKTKKELKKLKKEKEDLEHLLKERLVESTEKDKDLSQKLSKALNSLKENEVKVTELTERLETSEAENNNLSAKISKLEGRGDYGFAMKAATDESKISEETVTTYKVKYIELQREHERLRHGYNGLKKFLEYLTTEESGIFADDFLGNEDSVGYSAKVDWILQRKPLKDEKKNSEELFQGAEINSLKRNGGLRKEKYDVETISMHYLQLENEDLKEEISDNRAFITQLMTKKKEHVQIIQKMFTEIRSLKKQLVKAMEANQARLHKSDHEITGLGPGNDGTTTQERQEGFEKRETAEQDQNSDFSSDEGDSLFLQLLDNSNDISLSEKD